MDLVETPALPNPHRHPWETARADFFLRLLVDEGRLTPGLSVLDVGAGDAWLASRLVSAAPGTTVTCWDEGYATASPAPSAALRFVATAPVGARHGLALLLDVLEHVEADAAFLRAIVEDQLLPDATILVSVPAWQPLYSEHDRRLRHHRRYDPARARELLVNAGLRIERSGGLFHSLLFPRALQRAIEGFAAPSSPPRHVGEWDHGRIVTGLLSAILHLDAALSRAVSLTPLELPGLSWWALCRKSS